LAGAGVGIHGWRAVETVARDAASGTLKGMSSPPDCLRCGVCCFSKLETYVRVSGDDWTRLGAEAERVAQFIGNRAYMRMEAGKCAALAVRATADGAAGGREFFCTIYERRPQVCRDLARGSPQCEGEIALKGGRPGATVVTSETLTRCVTKKPI
jgi:hypothetical protein